VGSARTPFLWVAAIFPEFSDSLSLQHGREKCGLGAGEIGWRDSGKRRIWQAGSLAPPRGDRLEPVLLRGAAVDGEDLAGDEAGTRAGEEVDRTDDVGWHAESAKRRAADDSAAVFLRKR